MGLGIVQKIRLGQATKDGNPKTSRMDGGVVYKDTDKVQPPMLHKGLKSESVKQSKDNGK